MYIPKVTIVVLFCLCWLRMVDIVPEQYMRHMQEPFIKGVCISECYGKCVESLMVRRNKLDACSNTRSNVCSKKEDIR